MDHSQSFHRPLTQAFLIGRSCDIKGEVVSVAVAQQQEAGLDNVAELQQ